MAFGLDRLFEVLTTGADISQFISLSKNIADEKLFAKILENQAKIIGFLENKKEINYMKIIKDLIEKMDDTLEEVECYADKAILCCGTGIGISMAANKVKGIRAACCSDYFSAKFTRLHNDANVLCMGARVIGGGAACELVDVFLSTEFEGGRHQRRVDQIMAIENGEIL